MNKNNVNELLNAMNLNNKIKSYLYEFLEENFLFDDIKDGYEPDEIKVVGYSYRNNTITVYVSFWDDCIECGENSDEISIDTSDFEYWLLTEK